MINALLRSGRQDLLQAVRDGDMAVSRAYFVISGDARRDGFRQLRKAWETATPAERKRFLGSLGK
jgi:hypothetical protein